jgi:short-subunit dehydrogenase
MAMSQPDAIAPSRLVTVVTGASSGIGRELALLAAREGEVLLIARGEAGLSAVGAEIAAFGGKASWLACDGEQPAAAQAIVRHLSEQGMACGQLVNNAGHGVVGLAGQADLEAQLGSIALNVRFLSELTLLLLPDMLRRGGGGVLNVSSVAAFLPGPGMATYYATKAYVQSFSDSLWQETKGRGVRVTALCPGPVDTGFLGRATGGARQAEATRFHVDAARVAREGWEGFKVGKRQVIPGLSNRVAVQIARFLPRAMLLKMVMRRQASRRDD